MRGQTSIEFILVLVVMLVILASITLPGVERMEQDVIDTGNAINLAAAQQKLFDTARELRMAGCGSHKNVTIYVPEDFLTPAYLHWNGTPATGLLLGGAYYTLNSTRRELLPLTCPINMDFSAQASAGNGYWTVIVEKRCGSSVESKGCAGVTLGVAPPEQCPP